jgi:hypothetical protein
MNGSAHLLSPCSHLRSLSFALRLPRTAAFPPSAVSFSLLRTTCVVSKRRTRSTITISGYQIACNTMLRVGNRAVARYRTCRRLVSLPRSADALAERVRAYNERSSRKSWAEQQLEDRHAPLIARALQERHAVRRMHSGSRAVQARADMDDCRRSLSRSHDVPDDAPSFGDAALPPGAASHTPLIRPPCSSVRGSPSRHFVAILDCRMPHVAPRDAALLHRVSVRARV